MWSQIIFLWPCNISCKIHKSLRFWIYLCRGICFQELLKFSTTQIKFQICTQLILYLIQRSIVKQMVINSFNMYSEVNPNTRYDISISVLVLTSGSPALKLYFLFLTFKKKKDSLPVSTTGKHILFLPKFPSTQPSLKRFLPRTRLYQLTFYLWNHIFSSSWKLYQNKICSW